MAVPDCPRADREDIQAQEAEVETDAYLHVCLSELRPQMGGIGRTAPIFLKHELKHLSNDDMYNDKSIFEVEE